MILVIGPFNLFNADTSCMLITSLLQKTFGTRNQRLIKQMGKIVVKINRLEPSMQQLSDEALRAKTPALKARFKTGESLDTLLPEAFAVVREASVRTLKLRHFDVQLLGGIVLHSGKIAEMRMGEGKTLVATLPAYLNALTGKGVHIVTVNDYLAQRDADWMRPIYDFLGMRVDVNLTNLSHAEKKIAYEADILYATNNELGFDYLRDNMAFSEENKVQRDLHYAIVDEVDSILIDEARTPLIISGMAEQSSDLYTQIDALIPQLKKQTEEKGEGDYSVDEKTRQAYLSETGHASVEALLAEAGLLKAGSSLYDLSNIALMHHVYAALRAHALFQRDIDYIVKNGEVIIVDEHTGRLMPGRRWSDGLHQATEAKEGVPIKSENQTLASITFQNFFRLYEKISGMTGTADTEAFEFQQTYGLEVVVIPTNQPVVRRDLPDQVYLTKKAKFDAIVANIKHRKAQGQPVLVGTASIDTSEYLSHLLTTENIPHQILNAKFHAEEAGIIAEAGRPGSITIATNMAGRGTDIVLGGNLKAELAALENADADAIQQHTTEWEKRHDQVIAAGGLHVLGSERNESRRIDNQLRGRSGRQGDPGSSQYYLSLEDNLMRIFAPERMGSIMRRLGMKEEEVIENSMITRSIENAQRKVEGHNFDVRKQLLEFDDVSNDQRKVIYAQRKEIMAATDISETIAAIRHDVLEACIDTYIPAHSLAEQWDVAGLEEKLQQAFHIALPLSQMLEEDETLHEENLRAKIHQEAARLYAEKRALIDDNTLQQIEKNTILQSLDTHWREHLAAMDHLRKGIHLRGYAQKNPKQEYKRESFLMFTDLLNDIKQDVVSTLMTLYIQTPADMVALEEQRRQESAVHNLQFMHPDSAGTLTVDAPPSETEPSSPSAPAQPITRAQPKIGRNDPCPCNSGKKYKQCHGIL
jgi:preprotein translocase subunit SecA